MSKPLLIIGHGIAGCSLAMTCLRRGIPFQLTGYTLPGEASVASSGLIAPITGRRYVKTWRIDEFLPFALDFYRWTETILEDKFFAPIEIVRFLVDDQAFKAWSTRLTDPAYSAFISDRRYAFLDAINKAYGVMTGGYQLNTRSWLHAVHAYLAKQQLISFEIMTDNQIDRNRYNVIWATGATDSVGAHGIIPNKGEALIVRMPLWKIPLVVKDEVFIVPMQSDLFWIGSYYKRYPSSTLPTQEGKEEMLTKLSKLYAGQVEVIEHVAGVRPTVDDRRPIIGSHPGKPGDFLFNGLGTKGTSLAPFWSDQLLSHIVECLPLSREVAPDRYKT